MHAKVRQSGNLAVDAVCGDRSLRGAPHFPLLAMNIISYIAGPEGG